MLDNEEGSEFAGSGSIPGSGIRSGATGSIRALLISLRRSALAGLLVLALASGCTVVPHYDPPSATLKLSLEPDGIIASVEWLYVFGIPYGERDASDWRNPALASAVEQLLLASGPVTNDRILQVEVADEVVYGDLYYTLYTAYRAELKEWRFIVGDDDHEITVGPWEREQHDEQVLLMHFHRGCWNVSIHVGLQHARLEAEMVPSAQVERGLPSAERALWSGSDPGAEFYPPDPYPRIRDDLDLGWGAGGVELADADAWLATHQDALCPNVAIVAQLNVPWMYVEPVLEWVDRWGRRPILYFATPTQGEW